MDGVEIFVIQSSAIMEDIPTKTQEGRPAFVLGQTEVDIEIFVLTPMPTIPTAIRTSHLKETVFPG